MQTNIDLIHTKLSTHDCTCESLSKEIKFLEHDNQLLKGKVESLGEVKAKYLKLLEEQKATNDTFHKKFRSASDFLKSQTLRTMMEVLNQHKNATNKDQLQKHLQCDMLMPHS